MQIKMDVKKIQTQVEDEEDEVQATIVDELYQLMLYVMVEQHVTEIKEITLTEQNQDVHSNVNQDIHGMEKNVLDEVEDEVMMKR
jgi:hypothetical protein